MSLTPTTGNDNNVTTLSANSSAILNTTDVHVQTSLATNTSTEADITTTSPWTTRGDVNISDECTTGLIWIRDHLGQCVETPTQFFSFSVAIIAIGLWIIAHFILLKSHHNENDCRCSRLGLILVAGLASVCNLVGCTLSDQLGTQVLTACYLIFSEVVFLIQWIHLWNKNRKYNKQGLSFYATSVASDDWKSPDRTREEHAMNGGELVLCLCIPCFVTVFCTMTVSWQHTDHASMSASGRKLLMVSDTPTDNFGYAMGFTTAVLFALCKIYTIVNMVRHKISFKEPISSQVLIISASSCYLISIVAYDIDPTFLINAIPWLLTSFTLIGCHSIIICLVLRNRMVGPKSHPVGRRRADGTLLLYPSEESVNSDLERSVSLRFEDSVVPNKLPSIQEEPRLESYDQEETEMSTDDIDYDQDIDAETASLQSRASDFILDDDEDVYVRMNEEDDPTQSSKRRVAHVEDDGLEWDFDDFRPKYTDSGDDDVHNEMASGLSASPTHHHSLGIPEDSGGEDYWDEERVLHEIERELDNDGDTISVEYDTAEEEDQFYQRGYSYTSQSQ